MSWDRVLMKETGRRRGLGPMKAPWRGLVLGLVLVGWAGTAWAGGYPSKGAAAAAVKNSDRKAFVETHVTGRWAEERYKSVAPHPMDQAVIAVAAKGKKHADGTWYEYSGLAIYRRGTDGRGPWRFDHYFVNEDSVTLKGFEPPSRAELSRIFLEGMRASSRTPGINAARTTHVYAAAAAEALRFRAQSLENLQFDAVLVVDQFASNTRLERRRIVLRARIKKMAGAWKLLPGRVVKATTVSSREVPREVARKLPRLSRAGFDAVFGEQAEGDGVGGVPSQSALDHALGTIAPVAAKGGKWFNAIYGPKANRYVYGLGQPRFDMGRHFEMQGKDGFVADVLLPLKLKYQSPRFKGGPFVTVDYEQRARLTFKRGKDGQFSLVNLKVPKDVNPDGPLAKFRTRRGIPEADWKALPLVFDGLAKP